MFIQHPNIIWGTRCRCGAELSVLQSEHHPWSKTDYVLETVCPHCGTPESIGQAKASEFYNGKILARFSDVEGIVLDLGCGGGFLSQHLLTMPKVSRVIALDNDESCRQHIMGIPDPAGKLEFILAEASALGSLAIQADYVVSRDIFMFIQDTDLFFDALTSITKRGIRQMAWYAPEIPRMKNRLHPHDIAAALVQRGWETEMEGLDWYKLGYFIKADK